VHDPLRWRHDGENSLRFALKLTQKRSGKAYAKYPLTCQVRPNSAELKAKHATHQATEGFGIKVSKINDINPHERFLAHFVAHLAQIQALASPTPPVTLRDQSAISQWLTLDQQ